MPPRRGVQGWREPVIEESTVWDRLVDKAFEITGNADEGDDQGGVSTLGLFSPRWEPSATIMYNDPYMGGAARPLEGVKVRVSTFIYVGSGYTDAHGNARGLKGWAGKFRKPVPCRIIWGSGG